jgi:hypothetical protein
MHQFPLTKSPIIWSSHSVPVRSRSDLRLCRIDTKQARDSRMSWTAISPYGNLALTDRKGVVLSNVAELFAGK